MNRPVHVSDSNFDVEVLGSNVPVLVDFYADWCGPCRGLAPVIDRLAQQYAGRAKIAKVNVDEAPRLSSEFNITSIPTLVFVHSGKVVGRTSGAPPEQALSNALNQLIARQVA